MPEQLLKQRYLVVEKLGQGGMGIVYKARDLQLGNRFVAIKEMYQGNLNQDAVDAFQREAELLAHLLHPHLPSIHEHFAEAGCWYLVMEFIEGGTLEDYVKEQGGWLPIQEVLEIGIQLCTVLEYLHTRQPPIIFRDLKPLNIMRSPDGHLYLIDFGIARHFKVGPTSDTAIAFSLGYAAPEQYPLYLRQTTPQSDIYSLGATLYRLLTGSNPSSNKPTPFDFPPLQFHGQNAPAGLDNLIVQMLEQDADKRPASAAEIKQVLQSIASQKEMPPIEQWATKILPSPQEVPQTTAPQPAVPRRQILLGAAALVVVGGGGIGWYLMHFQQSGAAPAASTTPIGITPTSTKPASPPVEVATFIAFRNEATNNSLATTLSTDGSQWQEPAQLHNQIHLQGGPAMASFHNKLYAAFRANDGSNLLYTASSSDGNVWPQISSYGFRLQGNPAMAAFHNKLYIAFRTNDGSNLLHIASSPDGKTWSQTISDSIRLQDSPTMATFHDKLYIAFRANDTSNLLYITSSSDGKTWPVAKTYNEIRLQGNPAMAAFHNKLYIAFRANNGSNLLYITSSSDGLT